MRHARPQGKESNIGVDERRRTRFLRIANRCWLALGFLATVAMPFYPGDWAYLLTLTGVTAFTFFLVRELSRRNKTTLASYVFCVIVNQTCYVLMLVNYYERGFGDLEAVMTRVSALALMGSSIVFAGALLGEWVAVGFAALNVVLLALAVTFVDSRLGPKLSIPFFWSLLAVAVWYYEREAKEVITLLERSNASLEDTVLTRTRDLQGTVAQLAATKHDLETSNRELETFSYSVAHDLKGPLRAVDGFNALLATDYADRLDEQGRSYVAKIRANVKRMDDLIVDLLSFARTSRVRLDLSDVDLSALASAVAWTLDQRDSMRSVQWTIASGLVVRADASLARIVLENLLGNAWKFTAKVDDPRIEVGSCSADGVRTIYVRDNGVGLDMTRAGRLFEPFERLHSAEDYPGTGIGLATVSRIIQRHGGRIQANGEIGKGATFSFTFE